MAENTAISRTEPWGPQGTGLEYGYGKARSVFDTQFGQPFPGYSPQTQAGLAAMQGVASGPNPFLGPTTDAVTGITSGDIGIGTGGMFGDMFSGASPNSLGGGMYGDVASGGLVDSNPYADAVLSRQMDDIANRVKSGLSTSGRYGANKLYADSLTGALGDVSNQFNLTRYDMDMQNMMRGAEGRAGSALSAAQGQTGVEGQNIANRMNAAGMAPGLSEFRYADPMRMSQIGAAYDEQNAAEQNYPWQMLQNYQSMFGSLPGSAGVTSQQGPDQSSWLSALGGAGAGAGIGSMFGPIGGLVGAGIGGLGSLLFG